jgi:hypothetical protein
MNALVAFVLGGGIGLGLVIVGWGALGRSVLPMWSRSAGPRPSGRHVVRLASSVALALAVLGLSHWLVAALLAAVAAWFTPRVMSGGGNHRREIERVEAIASWAEMLRDTVAGAAGLEQAIVATGPIAPTAIAPHVSRLAVCLDFEPLPTALRRFADDVGHPTCDFVVAALVIASEREARDLGPLLSQLADCARDEARMRTRIWIDRAKTRTSVRVIGASVLLFAAGLLVLSRSYLAPYDAVEGQFVLLVIGAFFIGSFVAMDRMGRIAMPERFVSRRSA